MTTEEISLKLGLDNSGFAQGVRSAKSQLADFSETSGKAFTHGASAAKGFKQALHEIADTSPILGTALKLAISPIGGIMIAAVGIFEHFKTKIEETNKELDRLGDLAAEAFGNMKEAAQKAREEVDDLNRSFRDSQKAYLDSLEDVTDGLSQQLETMQSQAKVNEELLSQEKEKALARVKAKEATGSITPYQAALQTHAIEEDFTKKKHSADLASVKEQLALQTKTRDELDEKVLAASQKYEEAHKAVVENVKATTIDLPSRIRGAREKGLPEAQKRLDKALAEKENADQDARERTGPYFSAETMKGYSSPAQRQKEAGAEANAASAALSKLKENIEKDAHQLKERTEKEKDLKEAQKDAEGELKKLTAAYTSTAKAADSSALHLDALSKVNPFVAALAPDTGLSKYAPSLDQLVSTRGPYQGTARQAKSVREAITQRLIQGDFAGADQLKRQLEGTDEMVPEVIAGNRGQGAIKGPAGATAQDEWYRLHGIDYKTGRLVAHHTPGLMDRLPTEKNVYDLLSKVVTTDNRLKIEPVLAP